MPSAPAKAGRRVAWGLFDQFLASGSNFVLVVLAARSLTPTGFGAFAIAVEVYLAALLVARGVASDPLAAAHAGEDPPDLAAAVRASGTTAIGTALLLAVPVAAAGLLVGGTLGICLLVLSPLLPGLVLQDYQRYALIVAGRPRGAFLNDLFWLVAQVPLLVAAGELGGPGLLVAAWAVTGNAAALLGLVQVRAGLGDPAAVRRWLARHRRVWPFFLFDNVVFQASNLILVVVVSAATSLAEVAALRTAMTVYAPVALVGRGVVGVAVPELSRWRDQPDRIRRTALKVAWGLAPLALVWGAATQLIPDQAGRALFGASWDLAEPLLLLASAVAFVSLFTTGTAVGLRALSAGREGLTARVVVSIVGLAAATAGAVVDGAHGVFVALAVTAPVQVATWWWLLHVAGRGRRPGPRAEPAAERGAELGAEQA